ncbi:hypothetical protein CJF42_03890 [Pseudoalteromonas sp. NBT06-2]|uniref:VC2046/SO_2500 family protein n=1 Tax=Pseudoalteromonas sp. NBT06-2 TaxID=2025950 RepID=UPI000BA67915|nr:VC2046/SO_2500 family protein [Pseudoalteromonas sp. NBT06-2]PAJ75644.1 hypothetical protein CJF42_03890 [Pseudoalteromonas sp. NBT06-2]
MQLEGILINEMQLGNQLSLCVAQNRRNDFSILLSMLSKDALDFSQFHLPQSEEKNLDNKDTNLRLSLGAGVAQKLAPEEFNMLIGESNAKIIQKHGLEQFRLINCLSPEPLAIRDDLTHIHSQIIDNCELSVRKRIQPNDIQLSQNQMNAVDFYNQLQEPQLHEPLTLLQA